MALAAAATPKQQFCIDLYLPTQRKEDNHVVECIAGEHVTVKDILNKYSQPTSPAYRKLPPLAEQSFLTLWFKINHQREQRILSSNESILGSYRTYVPRNASSVYLEMICTTTQGAAIIQHQLLQQLAADQRHRLTGTTTKQQTNHVNIKNNNAQNPQQALKRLQELEYVSQAGGPIDEQEYKQMRVALDRSRYAQRDEDEEDYDDDEGMFVSSSSSTSSAPQLMDWTPQHVQSLPSKARQQELDQMVTKARHGMGPYSDPKTKQIRQREAESREIQQSFDGNVAAYNQHHGLYDPMQHIRARSAAATTTSSTPLPKTMPSTLTYKKQQQQLQEEQNRRVQEDREQKWQKMEELRELRAKRLNPSADHDHCTNPNSSKQ